ncbi:hypothetical protein ABZ816_05855 [Actinosynnema sp. NPDC047251]|uniref:Uncharacterized protein n=1 Tax=Saccharothrix espanaensis (strain ATCC 51144 / DSM 44229 / JCM 9112 / NBRC 15066 / NRRL 15764) TaxID=1179773 RepID=K0JRL7_SACES|nr:hypothetical protein [Saccharothrix espanaensis]CCH28022.1 hypothetical protein BN6_06940 [Saccharothrix espanaensis DSM 44229]
MDSLGELEYEARTFQPRLFALVGVSARQEDDPGFVAWGMEFEEPRSAVLWSEDGGTWQSTSAAALLARHQLLGDARLIWLEG